MPIQGVCIRIQATVYLGKKFCGVAFSKFVAPVSVHFYLSMKIEYFFHHWLLLWRVVICAIESIEGLALLLSVCLRVAWTAEPAYTPPRERSEWIKHEIVKKLWRSKCKANTLHERKIHISGSRPYLNRKWDKNYWQIIWILWGTLFCT